MFRTKEKKKETVALSLIDPEDLSPANLHLRDSGSRSSHSLVESEDDYSPTETLILAL